MRELGDRLLKIEKLLTPDPAKAPKGVAEPVTVSVTTSEKKIYAAKDRKWFSVTVVNDGPSTVLARPNTSEALNWHTVKAGETWGMNTTQGVIKNIGLKTTSGTASVRLVGVR